MKQKTIITLLVGILLGILLCLIARPVGRYQVSAAQDRFAVVDTVTGQVWLRHYAVLDSSTDCGTPRHPILQTVEACGAKSFQEELDAFK
jgi:hypothetical protein